jgi:inosine-uridine preferring nucleoside hydrolase
MPSLSHQRRSGIITTVIVLALILTTSDRSNASEGPNQRSAIIFDTDMNLDIDDMLALAILHALESRHETKIAAITCSVEDRWGPTFIDLVDTFYGRPEIPVGFVRGGFKPQKPGAPDGSALYSQYLSELRADDGKLVFPHSLINGNDAPDAVLVLRRALSEQADNSVVMLETGASTNFLRLLDSLPDTISGLTGMELVKRKVRFLSIMAGIYQNVVIWGHTFQKGGVETNVFLDVPSAKRLFSRWPSDIVASGMEVGGSIAIPGEIIQNDFNYQPVHPIAMAYKYSDKIFRQGSTPIGKLHDHYTFDLTSAVYAVRPSGGYFSLSPKGRIVVSDDGSTIFEQRPDGNAQYLKIDEEQRIRLLEAMELLVSQPPQGLH